jgi:hypothetical protein
LIDLVWANGRDISHQSPVISYQLSVETLAKFHKEGPCHSERSEESRILKSLRSFTSFRMTK